MKTILTLVLASSLAGFAAACATSENTSTKPATNTAPDTSAPKTAARDDVPPSVHAVFPDAQSITKDHKDLTAAQIADIEKETGGKLPDTDHHAYLAFSTSGGARKQIGAASEVAVNGKHVVIVYESRTGLPYIKEVRADSRLKLSTALELGYFGLTINVANDKTKGPLSQSEKVRQALDLALDREAINQVVFNGEFTPGN